MKWIDDLVFSFGFDASGRPSPSSEMLDRLQLVAGGTLPPEFRYFMARYGAGFFGDEDFCVAAPIAEQCPWGTKVDFSSTHALHGDELINVQRTYNGRIPAGVIVFASDAGGNEICLDVAGRFPGSVWFWDHEQRWFREHFPGSLEDAARELDATGIDARRLSVHGIIRAWARQRADRFDRPPDYMGMYRMAPSFADFLRSLRRIPQ